MIKKLSLTSIVLGSLLLSGCGGGSGGTKNPLNDKNYIIIFTELPAGICETTDFRTRVSSTGLQNFITEETENTTSCETYGKRNDDVECTMDLFGGGSKNCVIGFDTIPAGYGGLARQTTEVKLFDTVRILSSSF